MADFTIRFLINNLFISIIIGLLLAVKRLFQSVLSGRMQYHLWFLLLGLLAVPFLPVPSGSFLSFFSWIGNLKRNTAPNTENILKETSNYLTSASANRMNDFTLSVSSRTPSVIGMLLCGIWLLGIFVMLSFLLKSLKKLHTLKSSAMPLQNEEVRRLYHHCLSEMKITKEIPVCSTAFLKSPIITGLFRPCIYLPVHLISDYDAAAMRYMLLHELQHYKHKDNFTNHFINLAGILYWFNPCVRYALKEMRNDREIACDTSVLKMISETEYENYGNTLLNFAEKISSLSFPFAAGISGNIKQMRKRILNIAAYEKPSVRQNIKGITIFAITAIVLLFLAPALSTCAADENHYHWNISDKKISYPDLSSYFGSYEGSFVLYDLKNNTFDIYDMEHATLRVSPDSTYKIYDALFGLEESVISSENSSISWNGEIYPFEAWNADQTLYSAMQSSVNWYFQSMDEQLGAATVSDYIHKIEYGNKNIKGGLSDYWLENSLKISPVEQVELFVKLYHNYWDFSQENIDMVKDSLFLEASESGKLYGKTGTGRVDGEDVNGWFVGCVEKDNCTYFFAVNIQDEGEATGSVARKTAMEILSDWGIW